MGPKPAINKVAVNFTTFIIIELRTTKLTGKKTLKKLKCLDMKSWAILQPFFFIKPARI